MAQRVLVTGGCGFIGSATCRHLVGQAGLRILNFDKLTYASNPRSLDAIAQKAAYEFFRGDVADRMAVKAAFSQFQPDAVIHLAAESHVDRSIEDPAIFVQTNVLGTCVMLQSAAEYRDALAGDARDRFRFLHVSTDEVYGSLDATGRFSETSAYDPSSPYSASKAGADHLVMAWYRTYGLPVLLVGSPRRLSKAGSERRSHGTSIIAIGGNRCAARSMTANAWA